MLVGVFAFLVGLCLAPLFITAYLLVNDLVTASRTAPTEANTWVSTANNGGFAAGSAAAGVLLEFQGPALTVTAAFAVAAAITVVTILRRRPLVLEAATLNRPKPNPPGLSDGLDVPPAP